MINGFSVLSLKRNRSTSNYNKGFSTTEPVSKLSKIRSGFSIFSKKITHSISQHHNQHDNNFLDNNSRRTSFIGLFQYFRSNEDHNSRLQRKVTYDSDRRYEYSHYHKERNMHTLPTASTKKLTSILIKRSGTNPSAIATYNNSHKSIKKANSGRRRTYSNATISNMTINSEDLTAKEFADIAGIRILPEEEEDKIEQQRKYNNEEEDLIMHTVSSRYTTKSSYFDNNNNDDDHERLSVLSYTSLQSYSTSKLKIWDNEFWLNPEVTTSRNNSITTNRSMITTASDYQKSTTGTSLDRKLSTASKPGVVVVEPPILHELRRMGTRNSEKDHCVIKKGRFEIHLGTAAVDNHVEHSTSTTIQSSSSANHHSENSSNTNTTNISNNNNTDSNLSFSDHQTDGVLEWKRKGKKSTL